MMRIQEIYSQELWSFIHHGVVTCLVCQKLCTGLFTCPYGAKTIALPACHALGCPVCQAAKATCTAGAQWEKICGADINPNWHEAGHFYLPCNFGIGFCQLNKISKLFLR